MESSPGDSPSPSLKWQTQQNKWNEFEKFKEKTENVFTKIMTMLRMASHVDMDNSEQVGNIVIRLWPQAALANEKTSALELKIQALTETNATLEENINKLVNENNVKCMTEIGKLNAWFDGLNYGLDQHQIGSMTDLAEVVAATRTGLEQLRSSVDEVIKSTEDKRENFVDTFQIQTEKTEKEMIEHMKEMIKEETNIHFIHTLENLKSDTKDLNDKINRIKEDMSKEYDETFDLITKHTSVEGASLWSVASTCPMRQRRPYTCLRPTQIRRAAAPT